MQYKFTYLKIYVKFLFLFETLHVSSLHFLYHHKHFDSNVHKTVSLFNILMISKSSDSSHYNLNKCHLHHCSFMFLLQVFSYVHSQHVFSGEDHRNCLLSPDFPNFLTLLLRKYSTIITIFQSIIGIPFQPEDFFGLKF